LQPSLSRLAVGAYPASRESRIQASIRRCGLEGQISVAMEGERHLRVDRLDPATSYPKVDCFVTEMRRLGLELGFIGNEDPATM
jgi:hypothetical protein